MSSSAPLFGWNPKLDIPSAVSIMPRAQVLSAQALISTVDSSSRVSELPSLPPLLEQMGIDPQSLGSGVLIAGGALLELLFERDFFAGFDEVWLFQSTPLSAKPEAVPLTSDVRLLQEPPAALTQWMYENDGFAGLGDGDGLNFITLDPDLAERWMAI